MRPVPDKKKKKNITALKVSETCPSHKQLKRAGQIRPQTGIDLLKSDLAPSKMLLVANCLYLTEKKKPPRVSLAV